MFLGNKLIISIEYNNYQTGGKPIYEKDFNNDNVLDYLAFRLQHSRFGSRQNSKQ
jgi:hypothetical protein